ncbi:MAG TPA: toll/interleukin-1 receptor domain-containing protein [Blastocatellia bacterium]|nr:toll/interleukin-1 receptor domain-containing protein [Blastocatellia bacterium]
MANIGPPRLPGRLRVFLCHSSGDKPLVRELYDRLRKAGFEPWLDEKDLLPGQDWSFEITRSVRNSDVVIVCLSKGSVSKAGFIQKEIKFALDVADEQLEGTIFIIPLKLEECEVPTRLNRWHWVNFFEEQGKAQLLRALKVRTSQIDGVSEPKNHDEPYQKITTLLRAKYTISTLLLLAGSFVSWVIYQREEKAAPGGTEMVTRTSISPTPQLQDKTSSNESQPSSPIPNQTPPSGTVSLLHSSRPTEIKVKQQRPSPSPVEPKSVGKHGVSFLEIVSLVQNNASEDRIVDALRKYGIQFKPRDTTLNQLRSMGASESLISAVKDSNVVR